MLVLGVPRAGEEAGKLAPTGLCKGSGEAGGLVKAVLAYPCATAGRVGEEGWSGVRGGALCGALCGALNGVCVGRRGGGVARDGAQGDLGGKGQRAGEGGEGAGVARVLEVVDEALGDAVGLAAAVMDEVGVPAGGGLRRGLGGGKPRLLPRRAAGGAEDLGRRDKRREQFPTGRAPRRKEEVTGDGGQARRDTWLGCHEASFLRAAGLRRR